MKNWMQAVMNPQIAIPLLAGVSVILIGGAILLWDVVRRAPMMARLRGAANTAAPIAVSAPLSPASQSNLTGMLGEPWNRHLLRQKQQEFKRTTHPGRLSPPGRGRGVHRSKVLLTLVG